MAKAKTWLWWHTWIGVTTGLLLFVICWSGTVAVLAHEIDRLLVPSMRLQQPAAAGPARWQETVEAARRALPGHRVSSIRLPESAAHATEIIAESPDGTLARLYADPHAARILGTQSYFGVQRFFRSFHMNLFFNTGAWGYLVVCAFALPLLASAITALLFYKRWWQRWFALKWDRGVAVWWSDVHKTGGLWSLWFVLLMGVTGVWYFVEAAGADFGYPPTPKVIPSAAASGPPRSVDELLAASRRHWPELEVRNMTLPGGYWGDVFGVDGQAGTVLVRDRANKLFVDPRTGEVLFRQDGSKLPLAARWVDTADPLHFGNFAGLAVKIVWFAFGLLLSAMCLTGAYLHVQRLQRQHRAGQRRPAVAAAYAVTAAILVLSAVGGMAEFRGYGPLEGAVRGWPEVPWAVLAFIGAWVSCTIAILAVWVRKVR